MINNKNYEPTWEEVLNTIYSIAKDMSIDYVDLEKYAPVICNMYFGGIKSFIRDILYLMQSYRQYFIAYEILVKSIAKYNQKIMDKEAESDLTERSDN